ncbi:hypothetical protein CPT_Mana_006 [Burkholderia phage Mana]|uniref:Uncharacterized protein n=1 Tax=Burkholderia phage Mana TaxID=2767578 RepID=A0A873WP02_9CAUD|nr:hypothetical protein KNV21_gp06 [Burkholderia phage Mana]QPB09401.1 hypothetical protein CPT_Mana_006 [Burkholderia phage Mana]
MADTERTPRTRRHGAVAGTVRAKAPSTASTDQPDEPDHVLCLDPAALACAGGSGTRQADQERPVLPGCVARARARHDAPRRVDHRRPSAARAARRDRRGKRRAAQRTRGVARFRCYLSRRRAGRPARRRKRTAAALPARGVLPGEGDAHRAVPRLRHDRRWRTPRRRAGAPGRRAAP